MSDPVADFLAREHDALAGIQDDSLETGAAVLPLNNGGLDSGSGSISGTPALSGAGDSGVDLPTLDGPAIVASNGLQRHSASSSPFPAVNNATKTEPEKIKKWREEQKIMLEKKDKDEERKKEEMRAAGKKELDDWYAQRAARLAKTRTANRKAEEEFIADRDSSKDGAEWDRIAKLCEFNSKNSKSSSDLSRLRGLLLQLKSQKE